MSILSMPKYNINYYVKKDFKIFSNIRIIEFFTHNLLHMIIDEYKINNEIKYSSDVIKFDIEIIKEIGTIIFDDWNMNDAPIDKIKFIELFLEMYKELIIFLKNIETSNINILLLNICGYLNLLYDCNKLEIIKSLQNLLQLGIIYIKNLLIKKFIEYYPLYV